MKKSEIGRAASKLTREQFADELSSLTSFSADEVGALFPNEHDREELAALIDIVKNAADENERRAKLIRDINKVATAVVRVVGAKVVAL